MDTLFSLTQTLNSRLKTSFSCKMDSQAIKEDFERFLEVKTRTDKGNLKVPQKFVESLRAFYLVMFEEYRNINCIFCYEVEGKLYTTYQDSKRYHSFEGTTEIPNYRDVEGIEDKILKAEGRIISGFYYPCGKPFYVVEK